MRYLIFGPVLLAGAFMLIAATHANPHAPGVHGAACHQQVQAAIYLGATREQQGTVMEGCLAKYGVM